MEAKAAHSSAANKPEDVQLILEKLVTHLLIKKPDDPVRLALSLELSAAWLIWVCDCLGSPHDSTARGDEGHGHSCAYR